MRRRASQTPRCLRRCATRARPDDPNPNHNPNPNPKPNPNLPQNDESLGAKFDVTEIPDDLMEKAQVTLTLTLPLTRTSSQPRLQP